MCVSELRRHWFRLRLLCIRADHMFAPSQWETALQSNDVSHWLGANLESALCIIVSDSVPGYYWYPCWLTVNWIVTNSINWMNYNENVQRFSFNNIYSKMSSAKYRSFCSDLDMLRWAWLSGWYRYPHFPCCAVEPSRGVWPRGGTPYVMGDTYVPRFWPPFFTLAGSSTIFLGYFSHPPTAKLSFGVQKLPIFTKIDLFGPKFNFFLDLFGSNFQRPAAHPHQFSGRVPPPPPPPPPPPGLCLTEKEGVAPSMGLICRDGLYDRRYIRTRLHDTIISHLDFIDRSSLAATFGSLTQTVHQAQYLLSSCCGIDSESLFTLVRNLSNLLERFDFVADW